MIQVSEQIEYTGIGVLDKNLIVADQQERLALKPEVWQRCIQKDTGAHYIYLQGGWLMQGSKVEIREREFTLASLKGVPLNLIWLRSNAGDLTLLEGTTKETQSGTIRFTTGQNKTAYLHIL